MHSYATVEFLVESGQTFIQTDIQSSSSQYFAPSSRLVIIVIVNYNLIPFEFDLFTYQHE